MKTVFTLTNPTGKRGYAFSLVDAKILAVWLGGAHVHKVSENVSEYIGWFPATSDCRYQVVPHEPCLWNNNVSSGYV